MLYTTLYTNVYKNPRRYKTTWNWKIPHQIFHIRFKSCSTNMDIDTNEYNIQTITIGIRKDNQKIKKSSKWFNVSWLYLLQWVGYHLRTWSIKHIPLPRSHFQYEYTLLYEKRTISYVISVPSWMQKTTVYALW